MYNNKSLYNKHKSLYIISWKLIGHDNSLSYLKGCYKEDSNQLFSVANDESVTEESDLGCCKEVDKI